MVSSVLADAILNQTGPDIIGSFERGREQGRQQRARGLASEALRSGGGEALSELYDVDPRLALQIGEQINARSAQDINDFLRDAKVTQGYLDSGNEQGALNFLQQRNNTLKMLGRDNSNTVNAIDLIRSGNSDQARQFIATITGAVDNSKISPLDQEKLGLERERLRLREEEIGLQRQNKRDDFQLSLEELALKRQKLAEKPQDQIKLSELRGISSDVTKVLTDAKGIRNAASRLDKISKTKSSTDQLAAIFSFMKALDPTSVVREGEQEQARRTGGATDAFIGYINQIQGEGGLPPRVFDEMVLTAKRLANQSIDDVSVEVDSFLLPFEDRIPEKFVRDTKKRKPKRFSIPEDNDEISGRATGIKFIGFE